MTKNLFVELSNAMADAAERAGKSTVMVDARRKFPASGILFAANLILTADHVVEREEDIRILFADGSEATAKLAGRDPGSDLAVLKLDSTPSGAAPAEVSSAPARVGQFALALGRPSKEGIQSSLGTVNMIGGRVRTGRNSMLEGYIKTDAVSYPGFSGGPLINGDGTIFGINTSGFGHGGAITIPADVAFKIGETLAKHGKIKRGYLGIRSQIVELSTDVQKSLKREQKTGLLLVGLEKDSPAGKSSLLVGDILTGVHGEAVANQDDLYVLLSGDVVGKSTPMEIVRGGKVESVNVEVGER